MAESKLHPLDFQALRAGQLLTQKEVEDAVGVPNSEASVPAYKKYRLKMLTLIQQIHTARQDLVAKNEGEGIRLLTDPEKVKYARKQGDIGVRKLGNAVKVNTRVDPKMLDAAQKEEWERGLLRDGLRLLVAQEADKSRKLFKDLKRGVRVLPGS